jgi:hypothetical protein
MMPKFSVIGIVPAQKYLGDFEADTAEEAIEMALSSDNNSLSICHQCSNSFELNDISCHEATAELVDGATGVE